MNRKIQSILNGTKVYNDPMGLYGNGKVGKVYTETEDKARKASKYEEQSLVTQYCQWFREKYPNIPYQINSKEQRRSYVAQNVLSKQEYYGRGVPDFQCDMPSAHYHTLRLEFKKSWGELFTGLGLLRPGSNGHFYIQDDYHRLLRKHGHYTTFVWSLDQAQFITDRYMSDELLEVNGCERSMPDYRYFRIEV